MIATKHDSALQRYVLGLLGLVAALVLLGVSATMNYRFGYSLGKTDADGQIYGAASAAADTLKAVVPFVVFWAWAEGKRSVFNASLTLWLVMTLYGLMGAAGHAALNRLDTTGQRALASVNYKDLRKEMERTEEQLKWLPAHRGADAIKADVEGMKSQLHWTKSNECTDPNGKAQREFCQGFHKLNAELGNAAQAVKLETRIAEIKSKLEGTSSGAVMSEADPQATILSKLTGGWLDVPSVQVALTLLIIAGLEVGGGLGPYACISYMRSGRREEEPKEEKTPNAPLAAGTDPVTALEPVPEPKALPGPTLPDPIPLREQVPKPALVVSLEPETVAIPKPLILLPGADLWLANGGFKLNPPRPGPLAAWPSPKHAAQCFACWLQAHGLEGPFSPTQILDLWGMCCTAYHKQQIKWPQFKGEIEKLRGRPLVDKKVRIDGQESPRPLRWFITSAAKDIRKFAAQPDPKQEASPDTGPRPLARASVSLPEAAANDNRRKKAAPAWLELQTREARQMKFMAQSNSVRSRKQRGNRVHRGGRMAA